MQKLRGQASSQDIGTLSSWVSVLFPGSMALVITTAERLEHWSVWGYSDRLEVSGKKKNHNPFTISIFPSEKILSHISLSASVLALALPRGSPVTHNHSYCLWAFRISDLQNDKPIRDGGNSHGERLKQTELLSNEIEGMNSKEVWAKKLASGIITQPSTEESQIFTSDSIIILSLSLSS